MSGSRYLKPIGRPSKPSDQDELSLAEAAKMEPPKEPKPSLLKRASTMFKTAVEERRRESKRQADPAVENRAKTELEGSEKNDAGTAKSVQDDMKQGKKDVKQSRRNPRKPYKHTGFHAGEDYDSLELLPQEPMEPEE